MALRSMTGTLRGMPSKAWWAWISAIWAPRIITLDGAQPTLAQVPPISAPIEAPKMKSMRMPCSVSAR